MLTQQPENQDKLTLVTLNHGAFRAIHAFVSEPPSSTMPAFSANTAYSPKDETPASRYVVPLWPISDDISLRSGLRCPLDLSSLRHRIRILNLSGTIIDGDWRRFAENWEIAATVLPPRVEDGGIKDGVDVVTLAVTFAGGYCGESEWLWSMAIRSALDWRQLALIGEDEPCRWDKGEGSWITGGFSERTSRWHDVSLSRDSSSACNRRDWAFVVLETKFDSETHWQGIVANGVCILPFGYVWQDAAGECTTLAGASGPLFKAIELEEAARCLSK